MKRALLFMTFFSGQACGGSSAAVQCDKDPSCDLSSGGRCTVSPGGSRWCAYPDGTCPSGFRFSTFQTGEGLAGVCVAPLPSDAGNDVPPAGMSCKRAVVFADSVYAQGGGHSEIWLSNLDGTNPINLSNSAATDDSPVWSPSGEKIAFSSDRGSTTNPSHFDIYTVNSDGSGAINLTPGSASLGNNSSPRWSPDGTRIAFIRAGEPWVMNADGSGATRIWMHQVLALEWAPAGNKLLAEDFSGGVVGGLYVIGVADGTQPRKLTSLSGGEFSPAWTSRIYFSHLSDLYSVNEDGTDLQNLTQDGLRNDNPRASDDSSVVAYNAVHGTPGSEVWVRRDGNSKRLSQVTLPSGEFYLVTDVSADGRYVVATHRTTDVKNPDGEGSKLTIVRLSDGTTSDFNAPGSEFAGQAKFAPCKLTPKLASTTSR